MDAWLWIVIAAAALLVVIVGIVAFNRLRRGRRTARLRARFGPEYDTAVHRFGRNDGERHLEALIHQHRGRRVRDVSPEERAAALRSWEAVQTSFVEAPVTAVRAADQLVFDVLRERGYPLETVDERASALSVEEPELAHRYREAHAQLARAQAAEGNGVDVGSLRDALLTYRDLLLELVGAPRTPGRLTTQGAVAPDPSASDHDHEEEPWTSTPTEAT